MKNTLPIVACGVAGLILGYGLTATVTYAQLHKAADSAQALQLSPVVTQASGFNQGGGGSCGS